MPVFSGSRRALRTSARIFSLPAFAASAEAAAYVARHTVPPEYRKVYQIDKFLRRLKAHNNGVTWGKITAFYPLGETDVGAHTVNLRNPGGPYDLVKVGTPTHTPGVGVSTTVGTSYYDTGIPLNLLSRNDATIGVESQTVNTSGTSDAGVVVGANGLSIACASVTMTGRCMSASATISTSTNGSNGTGFYMLSRLDASIMNNSRDGAQLLDTAAASIDLSASSLTLHVLKVNGSASPSVRTLSAMIVGAGFTEAEKAEINGAWKTYFNAITTGLPIQYDRGIGPTIINVDALVVGATSMGIVAADEFQRQGKSTAIVSGPLEYHLGGMSGPGGLGFTDYINKAGIGGRPKTIWERMKVIANRVGATDTIFRPRDFEQVCREALDPTYGGHDTIVYWSDGIASVVKIAGRVRSLTTVDGRTFNFRYFMDCTYEGDTMPPAGIPFDTGREASGSGTESVGGYRGTSTAIPGTDQHQYSKGATYYNISPFIIDGNAGSGILPGLIPLPAKTLGQADGETQSFNHRLTLTATAALKRKFPSTAPVGFNDLRYEPLYRWCAAATATATPIVMEDIFNLDILPGNLLDCNSDGGFGSDLWGSGTSYVAATTTAGRLAVATEVRNHILGLWWVLQYSPDARIPASLRTAALGYGLASDHYLDPRLGEPIGYPNQLYVRQHRRMVGQLRWNANDLNGLDGTTPRSIKTMTLVSYTFDHHHMQSMADTVNVPPRIWNEGCFFASSGGVDNLAPVPIEAYLPMKADCENGVVIFAGSFSDVAFGGARMEITAMQAAQSNAVAICVAMDAGDIALQDLDYPTVRTRLGNVVDVVKPVLTQVN